VRGQFGGWNDIVWNGALSLRTGELKPIVNAFADAPPNVWKPSVAEPPRIGSQPLIPE
jgi:hypothetical protein